MREQTAPLRSSCCTWWGKQKSGQGGYIAKKVGKTAADEVYGVGSREQITPCRENGKQGLKHAAEP